MSPTVICEMKEEYIIMMDPSDSGQRRSLCIQMDAYEACRLVHLLGNSGI